MLEEPVINCPYCGESFSTVVDCTAGNQQYVEDCFVCCQPIVLSITVAPDGSLDAVDAAPENP
ncbi:MAG: CPXCG motif-containing cysteine-rich protein [Salinisphaera sp.]|jgi:hypothetical protein|nr:CPXCG motif-containing cysteine-rich protein [Salinisphaera sp.]